MTIDKAYLVGTSVSSYKAGVPGEIIGVILIKPNKNSEENGGRKHFKRNVLKEFS